MGDRANVVVMGNGEQICLYTHWNGTELPVVVLNAMKRGEDRLDDYQYLNRIVFCEMVKGREMELTGFGISNQIQDSYCKLIEINIDKKTVTLGERKAVSFDDYLLAEEPTWYEA